MGNRQASGEAPSSPLDVHLAPWTAPEHPKLRSDLLIRKVKRGKATFCELKLPGNAAVCTLYDFEFELAKRMDGTRDLETLAGEGKRLAVATGTEDVRKFVRQLAAYQFIENAEPLPPYQAAQEQQAQEQKAQDQPQQAEPAKRERSVVVDPALNPIYLTAKIAALAKQVTGKARAISAAAANRAREHKATSAVIHVAAKAVRPAYERAEPYVSHAWARTAALPKPVRVAGSVLLGVGLLLICAALFGGGSPEQSPPNEVPPAAAAPNPAPAPAAAAEAAPAEAIPKAPPRAAASAAELDQARKSVLQARQVLDQAKKKAQAVKVQAKRKKASSAAVRAADRKVQAAEQALNDRLQELNLLLGGVATRQ